MIVYCIYIVSYSPAPCHHQKLLKLVCWVPLKRVAEEFQLASASMSEKVYKKQGTLVNPVLHESIPTDGGNKYSKCSKWNIDKWSIKMIQRDLISQTMNLGELVN